VPDEPPPLTIQVPPPLAASAGAAPGVEAPRLEVMRPAPFHPAASALLIVVDNLWCLEEFLILDWILTIPLSFVTVFAPTYWIQRRLAGDGRAKAMWKALFFGVVAAVPFSVTGTPVGMTLLGWAGVRHWKQAPVR